MPPTISRLRCSSRAIRRNSGDVERVVMRDERPGRGAAGDGVQHGRFDFEVSRGPAAWRGSNP